MTPTSRALRKPGLDRTDAHHVMLAIREHCKFFITCDARSILKYRNDIEAEFPAIKLRQSSEVVAALG